MTEAEPTNSEANLLDEEGLLMETEGNQDHLSDSVTQINLSGILNKTVQNIPTPQESQIEINKPTENNTSSFLETTGKNLKSSLIIMVKASHHKTFMETCLMRNSPPKNMSLWVQPHIYHSNSQVEKQWKDTLHQASLNLTSTLINHYAKIIKNEQENLENIKREISTYLSHLQASQKDETIARWKAISKQAVEEARKLGERQRKAGRVNCSVNVREQKA